MVAQPVSQPRAALYVRVSSDKQETNYSLPTQEAACRKFAAQQGYSVAERHIFREVHTATDLWERPALTAARDAMARGEFDVFICYDPDRFSRKQTHAAILQDICDRAGVGLQFAMFDFQRDATGQFLLNARVFAGELELEKLRERSGRGKRARVQAGRLMPGCKPLYGYQFRDAAKGAYDVDPVTAPTVRAMFAASAEGKTLRAIALDLEARGIPTPTGRGAWQVSTVRNLLKNPAYAGRMVTYRYQHTKVGGKRIRTERPAEEQVPLPAGVVPPLVTEETFAAVQARLRRNQEQAPRNNRNPEATLLRGGYVRCGVCGRAMTVTSTKGGRFVLYVCKRSAGNVNNPHPALAISVDLLDAAAWQSARTILQQPELIERKLAGREREQDARLAGDLQAVEGALAEVEQRRAKLVKRLAIVDDEDAGAIAAELRNLRQQQAALTEERDALLGRQHTTLARRRAVKSITEWCQTVASRLDTLSYDQKRLALDYLGVQARVWGQGHAPRYEITASIPLDGAIAGNTSGRTPASTACGRCRRCARGGRGIAGAG